MLINILINKVILFDDVVIIIFNINNTKTEIKLDLQRDIEDVLLKGDELHHL